MEDILIPIFGMATAVVIVIGAIWLGTRMRIRRYEATSAMQQRMLEKFGSGTEFLEFVKTSEGRDWLTLGDDPKTRSTERILGSLRWGLIGTFLGGAFLALTFRESDLIFPAFFVGSIGLGFLAHAWLAARLSRKWGMMPSDQESSNSAE